MFRRTGIWLSVIILGIAGAAGAAEPEWTNIGPTGQAIRSIGLVLADHPNRSPASVILYAGTSKSGVFRSVDQGATWIAVNNGLTDLRIRALAVHQRGVPSRAPVTRYETVIYAITDAMERVFRSLDSGASWTAVDADLGLFLNKPYRVNALATDPAGDVFVGTSYGAFKSSDGGDSWLPIERGKGLSSWAQDVARSTDGGKTWHLTNAGFPNSSEPYDELKLALDPVSPGTVYAATAQGVFRSGPAPDHGLPRVVPRRQGLSGPFAVADR